MDSQADRLVKFGGALSLLQGNLDEVRESLLRWETFEPELQDAFLFDWEYAVDGWLGGVLNEVSNGNLSPAEMQGFMRFRNELAELAPTLQAHGFTVPDLDL